MAPYLVAPGGDPFEWQEDESAEVALGPAREGVLSSEQITFFKDEGYLIVRGFVEPAIVARWQGQFWTHIGADRADEASWLNRSYVTDGFTASPRPSRLPQMRGAVHQLGGASFRQLGGGGGALVRWPDVPEGGAWEPPAHGHLDGYGNPEIDWTGGFILKSTTYVEDVPSHGGCFTFWPRSHLAAHRYFSKRPEHVDGSFANDPAWDAAGGFDAMWADGVQQPPQATEFVGQAGDTILWHAGLVHTGSPNAGNRPRIALFAGWAHKDLYVPNAPLEKAGRTSYKTHIAPLDSAVRRSQLRYSAPLLADTRWEYWSAAVQGSATVAARL